MAGAWGSTGSWPSLMRGLAMIAAVLSAAVAPALRSSVRRLSVGVLTVGSIACSHLGRPCSRPAAGRVIQGIVYRCARSRVGVSNVVGEECVGGRHAAAGAMDVVRDSPSPGSGNAASIGGPPATINGRLPDVGIAVDGRSRRVEKEKLCPSALGSFHDQSAFIRSIGADPRPIRTSVRFRADSCSRSPHPGLTPIGGLVLSLSARRRGTRSHRRGDGAG